MSQAAEPLLREAAPAGDATPSSPPAAAHVIALPELEHPRAGDVGPMNGARRAAAPVVSALGEAHNPLRHLKARLTVCVGSVELTVGELLAAKEQQVLVLDRAVEHPVDVLLEGHVVARGTLMAVDERFAVRITEIATALDGPLVTGRKG